MSAVVINHDGAIVILPERSLEERQGVRGLQTLTRPLSIGTDCSGMDTPIMALDKLGVAYKHMFSSDIHPNVRRFIQCNFSPAILFEDIMARDNSSAAIPSVDLYIAGFPCQSFSCAGKREGARDKRGVVFLGCLDFIERKRPRAFVLENVRGLLNHDGGETFENILSCLRNVGNGVYSIEFQLIKTQHHGVPQSRSRVYIVGIRKDCQRSEFSFPEDLPLVSIEDFLDPISKKPTWKDVPSQKTANACVVAALEYLTQKGDHPFTETFVVDMNASPKYRSVMRDQSICLTCSRPQGHWLSSRGRNMNIDEMLRLQGMEPICKQVVTNGLMGAMIGNAMSQNVVERLLIQLLPAAGLIPSETALKDRWAERTLAALASKSREWSTSNQAYKRKLHKLQERESALRQAMGKKAKRRRKIVADVPKRRIVHVPIGETSWV